MLRLVNLGSLSRHAYAARCFRIHASGATAGCRIRVVLPSPPRTGESLEVLRVAGSELRWDQVRASARAPYW